MGIRIALAGNPELREDDTVQRADRFQSVCGKLAGCYGGEEGGKTEG